ncbi:hypothetical protein [Ohtaekwangia koreensis]|uniref:Uncharacterized protein n=1 Tax=Ohtaekwangia koreensis TaxID=688867 RepID=A0A1T5KHQ2_9BACT|nr:hypothetical protein [Ohtaekwangia koreensis]SKC63223.1 hypothetical protein SAMN05660236_2200 [Ohtaekwangia koreensis]
MQTKGTLIAEGADIRSFHQKEFIENEPVQQASPRKEMAALLFR